MFVCLLISLSAAQQPSNTPASSDAAAPPQMQAAPQDHPAASDQQGDSKPKAPDKNKADPNAGEAGKAAGTSNDRLFYALPNFLSMESAGKLPPLTAKQKFGVVARSSFDYVQIPWYGFLSAISQAQDSEEGYEQGWGGYGKRFGAAFADGTIENFMTSAILPSMLHQDPRYYQLGKGSFMHRAFYSVSRNFVTLSDSGGKQFNYSEVVGGALSAAISTYSYHPKSKYVSTPTNPHLFIPSDRTLKNTVSVWGTQLGYDTITIVVKEFWPDIHRKLSHKNKTAPAVENAKTP